MTEKTGGGEKLIVNNRRAFFNYAVDERYEGGLVLVGSEVKSMRAGKVDMADAYAAEELIAQLGSALIGADLGLPVTQLDNHASYIDHWLRILRADERALMTAAARAEEAAAYLLTRAGRGTTSGDDDVRAMLGATPTRAE